MKILVAGGGSGGHVTPTVAVIAELKKLRPNAQIRFVTDRKFYKIAQDLLDLKGLNDVKLYKVSAGKFRRYAHFNKLKYLIHPSIMLANFFDLFKVGLGLIQSKLMILIWRPDVVFVKGGYVGLPVGLSVGKRPLVIHDSDAAPGLTNRILARHATKIATGMPLENYHYDAKRSIYTGIPVENSLEPANDLKQAKIKTKLGFNAKQKLVVVTGGGLGAKRLNDTIISQLDHLLPLTSLVLIAGRDQYQELGIRHRPGLKIYDFVTSGMADLLMAADVVVARAGATTIAELAALAKPTILVPNAMLPGSHQVKNAASLAKAAAVVVLDDSELIKQPQLLTDNIRNILDHPQVAKELSDNIAKFAKPHAAKDLATIILGSAKGAK